MPKERPKDEGWVPGWLMKKQPPLHLIGLYSIIILRYADHELDVFCMSQSTMAQDMGVSVDTIRRWLCQLEDIGALVKWSRYDKYGGRRSDFVALCWEGPYQVRLEQVEKGKEKGAKIPPTHIHTNFSSPKEISHG